MALETRLIVISIVVAAIVFASGGIPLVAAFGGARVHRLRLLLRRLAARRDRARRRDLARVGHASLERRPGGPRRRRGAAGLRVLARARLPRALPRALGGLRARADLDLAAQGDHAQVIAPCTARMLRYRVAAMVWMFMLLGAAFPDGLPDFSLAYVWATLALASSYVAATSVNDIADADIDRVNHPRDSGRPARHGRRPARATCGCCTPRPRSLALAAAAPRSACARSAIVARSLLIGIAYSLRPSGSRTGRIWLRSRSPSPTSRCRTSSARSPRAATCTDATPSSSPRSTSSSSRGSC